MTTTAKLRTSHAIRTIAVIVATTLLLGGTVATAFGAYYSFERKVNAEEKRAMIWTVVGTKESKEHAQEQHSEIGKRIDAIQIERNKTLGRIEKTLEKLDARTWAINDHLKNGGRQ